MRCKRMRCNVALLACIVLLVSALQLHVSAAAEDSSTSNPVYYSGVRVKLYKNIVLSSNVNVNWRPVGESSYGLVTIPKGTQCGRIEYYAGRFQGIKMEGLYHHGFSMKFRMIPNLTIYGTNQRTGARIRLYGANELLEVISSIPTTDRVWSHEMAATDIMYRGGDIQSMLPSRTTSGSTSYKIPTSLSSLYGAVADAISPDVSYCAITQKGRESKGKFDAVYQFKKSDALGLCTSGRHSVVFDESILYAQCFWFCLDNIYTQRVTIKCQFTICPSDTFPGNYDAVAFHTETKQFNVDFKYNQ